MHKKLLPVTVLIGVLAVSIAAVGCVTERTTVEVDGSSTVFPITQRIAEDFRAAGNEDVQVPIGVSGTGGGFERFVTGETDISNASRPIKDSERESAVTNGVEFIELTVAFDGIAVVTHPDTDFVQCLTVDQLHQIWVRGSSVENWNQVEGADFPDDNITLYGPDRDSGTYDYFTEEIVEEEGARSDYAASADDNVLVRGVESESGSLGYFGLSYYLENQESLRLISVDGGNGCVEPNLTTVGNGSYAPLSRPLFIYVNVESLERDEVAEFVNYYIANAPTVSQQVGYVPLPASDYSVEQAELDAAIG